MSFSYPRLLEATDSIRTFDCGTPGLNQYLRTQAWSSQANGDARCYVSITGDGSVAAYHTLSTGSAGRGLLPGRLRKNAPDPVPALVIGRFAVDLKHQGLGLGKSMFQHAIQRALDVADIAGLRVIVVHTRDEEARNFWLSRGFRPMLENEWHLVLGINNVRGTLGPR